MILGYKKEKKHTTSSTTSMAGREERRAEMPRRRQRLRSFLASSWRSRGRFGSTPAPPCTAMAQPPILSLSSLWSLSFSLLLWYNAYGSSTTIYRASRTSNLNKLGLIKKSCTRHSPLATRHSPLTSTTTYFPLLSVPQDSRFSVNHCIFITWGH